MPNDRAIPQGYLTVGEAAKKMGVSVRTLQHYDKTGLLAPSAYSEGGRRLYSGKDLVTLHQILALKRLGFSLTDIKTRLIPLNTPQEVARALSHQAAALQQQIESLSESLRELEALRQEVLQMQSVDFQKYADIIVNLQMKNDYYWLIKHFDDDTLAHIRTRFTKESGADFLQRFLALQQEAVRLYQANVPPKSAQGLAFAKAYWALVQEFTGGDMSLLPKLVALGTGEAAGPEWQAAQAQANAFVGPALEGYFAKQGIDPFQEALSPAATQGPAGEAQPPAAPAQKEQKKGKEA